MCSSATPLVLSNFIPSLTQSETIEIAFTDAQTEQSETTSPLSLLDKLSVKSIHINFDDSIVFRNNGYKKIKKMCNTLQGELYHAIKLNTFQNVAIKKTSKYLFNEQITIEDGFHLCVSENIIKETLILKYLTIANQCIGGYIVKYIDFFESDANYYLVMEYIESATNLKRFVSKSNEYIKTGKLDFKEYQKMMKYLLWQLFVTVQWMHLSMHCVHLDMCSENIMLMNGEFIHTKDGVFINPKISVKICDYGVAEMYDVNNLLEDKFLCDKQGLSIFNETYFAPNVFKGHVYDARYADNYSLGMILFECMTVGQQLYKPFEIYQYKSGYWAIHHNKLHEYLCIHNLSKYFNFDSFNLLNNLLNVNEKKRLSGIDILTHKWFKSYFEKYKKQIEKKFNRQEEQVINQKNNLYRNEFPFYS